MDYWQYNIHTDKETAELLLAYLSSSLFESFEETEEGLCAYLPHVPGWQEQAEALLRALQRDYLLQWKTQFLPEQNWNAVWEGNFSPVIIEDFCAVRAPFHSPVQGVAVELVLEPKMAFGTGHHETTWMCLKALRDLPCADARLLDFGCGSGILAILAARLGAKEVIALDVEESAFHSAIENSRINDVGDKVRVYWGSLEKLTDEVFDGIMANITRNVILASLEELHRRLCEGGWLLVSGILNKDAEEVCAAAERVGFLLENQAKRGEWRCLTFKRV
ncbi:MAG: 50S ribosomal protein L11 methyltransferase [Saprospiraceae bacterium]|nr:50S ribosomal protein L11 methyltransferase [Saprospiraceae bacterium]MDW8483041.1 50S ribosomal protein L11 methyltransferase [Saprospiraceae bacterium]